MNEGWKLGDPYYSNQMYEVFRPEGLPEGTFKIIVPHLLAVYSIDTVAMMLGDAIKYASDHYGELVKEHGDGFWMRPHTCEAGRMFVKSEDGPNWK